MSKRKEQRNYLKTYLSMNFKSWYIIPSEMSVTPNNAISILGGFLVQGNEEIFFFVVEQHKQIVILIFYMHNISPAALLLASVTVLFRSYTTGKPWFCSEKS